VSGQSSSLPRRTLLRWSAVALLPPLAACGRRDDPQAALDAAVLALLDAKFRAQDELDREWARKTMALVFLRYQNVKVIAVSRSSSLDPAAGRIGRTEAQVLVTGAQGLIPERVSPYAVQMEWWRDGDDWKLRDLRWQ
jgi:hypothetical protein